MADLATNLADRIGAQGPLVANRCPPTANRCPPTANRCPPTANRSPPTAGRLRRRRPRLPRRWGAARPCPTATGPRGSAAGVWPAAS
ncbi:hypothetical protein CEY15_07890 [Dietzia natronolimnaea]|uniref:Uncharacterized protein n=1 Tax=Dietzia natronolimnaea TaxID=161920 RepID=A0A2A2WR95_9ACTN|nr:hypothetical protein CEY15_07890 [Dietzia natronolimnaea]